MKRTACPSVLAFYFESNSAINRIKDIYSFKQIFYKRLSNEHGASSERKASKALPNEACIGVRKKLLS